MKQVRLLLLRHGECEGGAILRGRVDVALTAKGWQQMAAAVKAYPPHCHGIYSSSAKRCAEFAKAFALEQSAATPTAEPMHLELCTGLQELDFGEWDGVALDALYHQAGDKLTAYWQNPWQAAPPGGESMASFELRVNTTIDAILDRSFARMHQVAACKAKANGQRAEHQAGLSSGQSAGLSSGQSSVQSAEPADDSRTTSSAIATAPIWIISHGGVIRHLMARALGAANIAGFYSQLTLPVAAVVSIVVLEDEQGERYWRLDWPSGVASPSCGDA
ncbi:MAG: histidine phosphatase family protein [Shewanella sp.]